MLSLCGLPLEVCERDVVLRGPVLCWSRLGHDVLCGGRASPVLCSSRGEVSEAAGHAVDAWLAA